MMPFIRLEDAMGLLFAAFVVFVFVAILGAVVGAAVDTRIRGAAAQPLAIWVASSLLVVAGTYTVGLSAALDEGMTAMSAFLAAVVIAASAGALVLGRGRTMTVALVGHTVVIVAGASLAVTWGDADAVLYLLTLVAIVGASLLLAHRSTRKALRE